MHWRYLGLVVAATTTAFLGLASGGAGAASLTIGFSMPDLSEILLDIDGL